MEPLVLTPGFGDEAPTATLYYGQDVRDSLRLLPDASIHTVCTSPPYFGLRNYGAGDTEIGQEATPEDFVEALVEVFREIKRVLRPDGTLWVNLGDSYSRGSRDTVPTHRGQCASGVDEEKYNFSSASAKMGGHEVIKPKDLVGAPWRLAFALQADGWYLRQDIIWNKPSCMPESVTDRCTKSHEYVFLFAHPDSKGRYYYDADAIREKHSSAYSRDAIAKAGRAGGKRPDGDNFSKLGRQDGGKTPATRVERAALLNPAGRNKRSVWNVNPKPYRGAHFAVWPPDLVRPMVLAGCPVGGVVLDPFSGSATTGMVALQEGRHYIGIDLNSDYLDLAQTRIEDRGAPQEAKEAPALEALFGIVE